MKVLFITSSAPSGNGESFVINEANSLSRLGVELVMSPVLIRGELKDRNEVSENIQINARKLLDLSAIADSAFVFFSMPRLFFKGLLSIFSIRPITLFKNILVFPKALSIARYVLDNKIDHIHAHWLSTPSTVAMVASIISGVPWSCTAHRFDIVANNLLFRKIKSASFVRFISKSGRSLANNICGDINGKARLLYMGASIPKKFPQPKEKDSFTVLCPASLIPVKGHKFLIDAWSRISHPKTRKLLLAGEGTLKEAITTQLKELELESSVQLLGYIPHAELIRLYECGEIDLVVLPSLDLGGGVHEGIPVSLMEAMAYKIPVISTLTGGIPELLHDGAGIMVPPSDAAALSSAIYKVINDAEIRLELRNRGVKRVSEEFNSEKNAEKLSLWISEFVREPT